MNLLKNKEKFKIAMMKNNLTQHKLKWQCISS